MNGWLQFFITLFGFGKATAEAVEKGLPSEKIQEEKFDEKKALREQDNKQDLLTDDFEYCKKRPEIDMWDHVRNVHPTMDMETLVRHHKMLVARVTEFRKDAVKWKWPRWRKYREWLKEK